MRHCGVLVCAVAALDAVPTLSALAIFADFFELLIEVLKNSVLVVALGVVDISCIFYRHVRGRLRLQRPNGSQVKVLDTSHRNVIFSN